MCIEVSSVSHRRKRFCKAGATANFRGHVQTQTWSKASACGAGWRLRRAAPGNAPAMRWATAALAKIIISAITAIMGKCTLPSTRLGLPSGPASKLNSPPSSSSAPFYSVTGVVLKAMWLTLSLLHRLGSSRCSLCFG